MVRRQHSNQVGCTVTAVWRSARLAEPALHVVGFGLVLGFVCLFEGEQEEEEETVVGCTTTIRG